MSGPLLKLPGKSNLHRMETWIVEWLFAQRPRRVTAREVEAALPAIPIDRATCLLHRIHRIHPLIQRRKRRTAIYMPFEYWYGVPSKQSRKRGHPEG